MKSSQKTFYKSLKTVAGPLLKAHYRLKVYGRENVPSRGGALIVSNHRCLADPFVLGYSVDRLVNFAAGSFTFKIPVVAQIHTMAGAFPLSIYGGQESDQNLNHAMELLNNGELVGIFPEGVQSFFNPQRATRIAPFKTGFIKMALDAKVPIVPCCVAAGEERDLPTIPGFMVTPFVKLSDASEGVTYIDYRKVSCRIGRPIDLSAYYDEPLTKAVLDRIADRVRKIIVKLYNGEDLDRFVRGEKPFDFMSDRI